MHRYRRQVSVVGGGGGGRDQNQWAESIQKSNGVLIINCVLNARSDYNDAELLLVETVKEELICCHESFIGTVAKLWSNNRPQSTKH